MTPHPIVTFVGPDRVTRCCVCQEPVILVHERRAQPSPSYLGNAVSFEVVDELRGLVDLIPQPALPPHPDADD